MVSPCLLVAALLPCSTSIIRSRRDTVDSVGLIPKRVPFAKYNHCIKTFRHAVALDERRVKFKANLYDKIITSEAEGFDVEYTPISQQGRRLHKGVVHLFKHLFMKKADVNCEPELDRYNRGSRLQDGYTNKAKTTDVKEVWFAGCHTGRHLFKPFLYVLRC